MPGNKNQVVINSSCKIVYPQANIYGQLTTLDLSNVEKVFKQAFSDNYKLTSVKASKLKYIGVGAFEDCHILKEVVLPTRIEFKNTPSYFINNPLSYTVSPKEIKVAVPVDMLEKMFAEAKASVKFNIDTYPIIAQVEKLLAPYNISFGNRIAIQIENFVNVYCSCFAASEEVIHTAVERILLSKVVSKLELKSVENKELLAAEFEKLNLRSCCEFILKLNED